jgi:polyphenol oxidase
MSLQELCITPDWPAPANIKALQTTRNGGHSTSPYDSFNLGSHVGDNPLVVSRNRMLLSSLMPSEPVWLKQVHGIGVVDAGLAGCLPEADASVTTHRGAVCVVMTADCLPILLCNDQGSAVAAAHAGWRSLCDGVIEATVKSMNAPGPSLMAWLGPAIGPSQFEVGDDVRTAFISHHPEAAAAFAPGLAKGGQSKWLADLYQLARLRLTLLGISRIYGGGLCTHSDPARFYSYRRDGETGRMGSFIWLS